MVDSVAVLPPGWRATGSNNALITDGILAFFDAGTTNPLEVFSDAALSVSLGTTVSCNAAGYPVSSGNNKVLIYTGTDPYKIRLTSVLFGGTVFEFDNVRGALDTSSFLTEAAVANQSIVNTSSNRAIAIADKGKLINLNCSAGALTVTFDDATDLGDGFWVGVRHDGTANQVRITGNGTDLFGIPGASVTTFSLKGRGETVWINCDGTGFKVSSHVSPYMVPNSPGLITIADRLSAPPGGPTPGARYIVTAAPSGAWSAYAEHDIAEADGLGGWIRIRLSGTGQIDSGWIAYVQDEDAYYFQTGSTWVQSTATSTVAGTIRIATQAEQEAASSTILGVTPGRQQFHPGHPKAWMNLNGTGTIALREDYGVASVADNGTGRYTVTFDTAFSNTSYAFSGSSRSPLSGFAQSICNMVDTGTKTASTFQIAVDTAGGGPVDSNEVGAIWCGDQ